MSSAAVVSFWDADDRTALGTFDHLELPFLPAPGQKFTFAMEFNIDDPAWRVVSLEHIVRMVDGEVLQMVDVFLRLDTPVRY